MKRILCLLLAVLILLPAVACTVKTPAETTRDTENLTEGGTDGATEPSTSVTALKTNAEENPLGFGGDAVNFTWQMISTVRGQKQTAYRVGVSTTEEKLKAEQYDVWDSGKVTSDQSSMIDYGGNALADATRYYWTVTVWDKDGKEIPSTEGGWFEHGLGATDWEGASWIMQETSADFSLNLNSANWIWHTSGAAQGSVPGGTQYFRLLLSLPADRAVKEAYLLFTCDDSGTASVNGTRIASCNSWKVGASKEITSALHAGVNAVAICVKNDAVGYAGLLAKVVIKYEDGTAESHVSDATWKVGTKEETGWLDAGFNDSSWSVPDQCIAYGGGAWGSLVDIGSGNASVGSAPTVRKTFAVNGTVASARVYATAAGLYNLYLNGKAVTSDVLNPGRTELDSHVMYQTYDITNLLVSGDNAVGAVLGRGWYIGAVSPYGGKYPAFLAKIVITYTDGKTETIATDSTWTYSLDGPILENDLFNGETYDATKDLGAFSTASYHATAWKPVQSTTAKDLGLGELIPQVSGTIQIKDTVTAVAMTKPQKGVYIYDFGQNLTGVVSVTLTNMKAGATVRLRHAEMLNDGPAGTRGNDGPKGTLYTQNLRTAAATDTYTSAGTASETYTPTFTYHGFRYMEITGIDEALPLSAVVAQVIYSDMDDSGKIETDSDPINQLLSNAYWGQRGNFLSTPTDCPQRDERMGWTGDAQVFAGTAVYNMDARTFYEKYLLDLNDCQLPNGAYPDVAPANERPAYTGSGNNGWADAGIIIPWVLYQQYGDSSYFTKYYDNMSAYIAYLRATSANGVRARSIYGDWLSIGESTPVGVTDTAYCAYVCSLMSRMAGLLGKETDAKKFATYADNYREGWCREFLNEDGTTKCGSQTSYVLGLAFNLIPEDKRAACAAALVQKIMNNGWRLSTGFLGVSYLLPVLVDTGYADVAFKLLEQTEYPSWLYPVLQGATTIWERWNSYTLETGFGDAAMNSFNHYSYGSVTEWMYSYLAGIQSDDDAPGFKHIILQPTVGGTLTRVSGSYDSVYGTILSAWRLNGDTLTYTCTVPANTTATLYLPVDNNATVSEGGKGLAHSDGVTVKEYRNGKLVLELTSGSYSFEAPRQTAQATMKQITVNCPDGITGIAVIDGKTYTLPVSTVVFDTVTSISVTSTDSKYTFAYFTGDLFATALSDAVLTGNRYTLDANFAYTGGSGSVTVSGENGGSVLVNGQKLPLPATVQGNGAQILLPIAPEGMCLAGWQGIKGGLVATVGSGAQIAPVFESLPCTDNLRGGVTAKASDAISTGDWNVKNLVDGVKTGSGYSSAGAYSSADLSKPVTVDFTFGKVTTVDRVVIYPRTDAEALGAGNYVFPQDFTVQVMKNGENAYTTVASYTGMADRSAAFTVNFDAVDVKAIRISVTKMNAKMPPNDTIFRVQFAEVEFYHTATSAHTVPVKSVTLQKGEGLTFTATVNSDAANKTLVYLVLDANGNPANGVTVWRTETGATVQATAKGIYRLLAYAADGSGAYAILEFTVS